MLSLFKQNIGLGPKQCCLKVTILEEKISPSIKHDENVLRLFWAQLLRIQNNNAFKVESLWKFVQIISAPQHGN